MLMRLATAGDVPAIRDVILARSAWLEDRGWPAWRAEADSLAQQADHTPTTDSSMWVLGDDGRIVGCTTVQTSAPPWGWIDQEFAEPASYLYTTCTDQTYETIRPTRRSDQARSSPDGPSTTRPGWVAAGSVAVVPSPAWSTTTSGRAALSSTRSRAPTAPSTCWHDPPSSSPSCAYLAAVPCPGNPATRQPGRVGARVRGDRIRKSVRCRERRMSVGRAWSDLGNGGRKSWPTEVDGSRRKSRTSHMNESAGPESEAPTHVVDAYEGALHAIRDLREHGVVIVDFRAAEEPMRARIADLLNGAALASGNSPFRLSDNLFFLTSGRSPTRAEINRYRDSAR